MGKFSDFFQGKDKAIPASQETPTGLNLQGPRHAASRMATYVNSRPIWLAGGIIAVLIFGAAIAMHQSKNQSLPPKVHTDANKDLIKNEQVNLENEARVSTPPASQVTSASSSAAAPTESTSSPSTALPPQTAPAPASEPAAPAQPSPQMTAVESALKAGLGSNQPTGNITPPAIPSDAQALKMALSQASQAEAAAHPQGPASLADYNPHLVRKPVSPYQINAGSVIPATLISGINSDLPGTITALVSQNVYASASGAYLLIPAGTRLVGTYGSNPKTGQRRVFVAWTQLIFPNGTTMDLSGFPGTSPRGYAGFSDEVDDHTWSIFKNALLISLIQTGMSIAQPGYGSAGMSSTQAITPTQVAEQNLANTFGQAEAQMLQSAVNVSPTLIIPPGYTFNVLIPKTLVFPGPYRHDVAPSTTQVLKSAQAPLANPYLTGSFPQSNAGTATQGMAAPAGTTMPGETPLAAQPTVGAGVPMAGTGMPSTSALGGVAQ